MILLILAVPCLVLTGLGLRMNQQERQQLARRAEQERQQRVVQFHSDLLSALERAKRQATLGREPGIAVLVAAVRDGKLVLPCEDNPRARQFRVSLEGNFGSSIRRRAGGVRR